MGSARWVRVAFSTALLVLLGCGVVTLGFAKAGHTATRQHRAIEAGPIAPLDHSPAQTVMPDRPEVPAGHGHVEHVLHVIGACAAVLAAVLAISALRRIGEPGSAAAERLAGHRVSWSTILAPPGLDPPARTLLCVQLH